MPTLSLKARFSLGYGHRISQSLFDDSGIYMGQYPTRRFTAINGAGRTRIYGIAAFDATMALEFVLADPELAVLLSATTARKVAMAS